MAGSQISASQTRVIDELVDIFVKKKEDLGRFLSVIHDSLMNNKQLMAHIHSVKFRIKEPGHLRDKLKRKILKALDSGESFDITPDTFFEKINDLVGIRLLHLHTTQFPYIHQALEQTIEEEKYLFFEPPFVRSWDDETKDKYKSWGISVQESPSMYTSVHYVVQANSTSRYTCEIQVRTLMEEVWGEVDHTINYPHKTESIACEEQLKALARLASGCNRLVDSVFESNDEFNKIRETTLIKTRKAIPKK